MYMIMILFLLELLFDIIIMIFLFFILSKVVENVLSVIKCLQNLQIVAMIPSNQINFTVLSSLNFTIVCTNNLCLFF